MLPAAQKKSRDAITRMDGLLKKLSLMVDEGAYCPKMLEIVLALQGHVDYMQGVILESHLRTCAEKNLRSKQKEKFIEELLMVIGLSTR
ncbi:metal-sensing transcriptional repressor [Candidatus Peribacteria bacterium]|nr:metal-sensing transcriptional repressor [Candidatus Peribacteria bacterium]